MELIKLETSEYKSRFLINFSFNIKIIEIIKLFSSKHFNRETKKWSLANQDKD